MSIVDIQKSQKKNVLTRGAVGVHYRREKRDLGAMFRLVVSFHRFHFKVRYSTRLIYNNSKTVICPYQDMAEITFISLQ